MPLDAFHFTVLRGRGCGQPFFTKGLREPQFFTPHQK
jgi:hypothetical protein